MAKKNYYAVAKGRVAGIYRTWPECEAQVRVAVCLDCPSTAPRPHPLTPKPRFHRCNRSKAAPPCSRASRRTRRLSPLCGSMERQPRWQCFEQSLLVHSDLTVRRPAARRGSV
jgi:hypothetical protein